MTRRGRQFTLVEQLDGRTLSRNVISRRESARDTANSPPRDNEDVACGLTEPEPGFDVAISPRSHRRPLEMRTQSSSRLTIYA